MYKKFLTFSLIIFTFLSFSPVSLAHQYKDVSEDSEYYYAIQYLRRNDVFKDTPNFYPNTFIGKAEFIKYLVILNSPEFTSSATADLPFEDTQNNAWYASYFEEAIKLGILDERDRNVEPNKKLSMIDALTLLFHSQSIPIPNVYKGNIPYTDVNRNKQSAPLIMRALSFDLISPIRNNYVGIYQRINRADAARMIYKMDLVTLGSAHSNTLSQAGAYSPELAKVISVWEIIEENYLNRSKINRSEMVNLLLKDLVESLDDPYSTYMNQDENRRFLDGLEGEIEGIGAVVGFSEEDEISIVSPIKGGPADAAGLMAKDIILEVDKTNLKDLSLEESVLLIKGPKGTTVNLKIMRGSKIMNITVERDVISIPSVEYKLIEGGEIMHLNLFQFNLNAAEQFGDAMKQVQNDSNIKGLIIDLRSNPGGLLDSSLKILGHFVEAQKDLTTINYADYTQVLLSRGAAELADFPVVVLINGGSASASEIVAGALQDYDLATIVGETSFGKGTVQEVNYFNDNSSLKLTVAKWLTPNLNEIQDGGIIPDVKVVDKESTEVDEQVSAAIAELKKLIR